MESTDAVAAKNALPSKAQNLIASAIREPKTAGRPWLGPGHRIQGARPGLDPPNLRRYGPERAGRERPGGDTRRDPGGRPDVAQGHGPRGYGWRQGDVFITSGELGANDENDWLATALPATAAAQESCLQAYRGHHSHTHVTVDGFNKKPCRSRRAGGSICHPVVGKIQRARQPGLTVEKDFVSGKLARIISVAIDLPRDVIPCATPRGERTRPARHHALWLVPVARGGRRRANIADPREPSPHRPSTHRCPFHPGDKPPRCARNGPCHARCRSHPCRPDDWPTSSLIPGRTASPGRGCGNFDPAQGRRCRASEAAGRPSRRCPRR